MDASTTTAFETADGIVRATVTSDEQSAIARDAGASVYIGITISSQAECPAAMSDCSTFKDEILSARRTATGRPHQDGLSALAKAGRIVYVGTIARYVRRYLRRLSSLRAQQLSGRILDRRLQRSTKSMSFRRRTKVVERCILMTTDPGDLVLDPTCGSGTTAYCRRAMGAALDHHRHLARGAGARPRADHGRALSLLPPRRQRRKAARRKAEVTGKLPASTRRPTATSARASSTSARRTSR